MFRTREQLLAFLDRYYGKDEKLYIPLIYAMSEMGPQYAGHLDAGVEPLTEEELEGWVERMEYGVDWSYVDVDATQFYLDAIEARDN